MSGSPDDRLQVTRRSDGDACRSQRDRDDRARRQGTQDETRSAPEWRKRCERVEETVNPGSGMLGQTYSGGRRRCTRDLVQRPGKRAEARLARGEAVGGELLHEQVSVEEVRKDRKPEEGRRSQPRYQAFQRLEGARVVELVVDGGGLLLVIEAREQAFRHHDSRLEETEAKRRRPIRGRDENVHVRCA